MMMDDMMDDDMMMSATATVTAANLNVRSGPGLDYDVLAVISEGSSYPALGRNDDGSWIEIDADGTIGWVSAEWVEVAPSVDDLMVVDMMMDDDEMMDEDEEMSDDDSGG